MRADRQRDGEGDMVAAAGLEVLHLQGAHAAVDERVVESDDGGHRTKLAYRTQREGWSLCLPERVDTVLEAGSSQQLFKLRSIAGGVEIASHD